MSLNTMLLVDTFVEAAVEHGKECAEAEPSGFVSAGFGEIAQASLSCCGASRFWRCSVEGARMPQTVSCRPAKWFWRSIEGARMPPTVSCRPAKSPGISTTPPTLRSRWAVAVKRGGGGVAQGA